MQLLTASRPRKGSHSSKAVKVIMKFMDRLSSNDLAHSLNPHCLVDADVARVCGSSEWHGGENAVQANDSTAGHNAVRRTRDSVCGLAKLYRRFEICHAICCFLQVVMRNINLIAQKQPNILQTDVRMFVCKYNDPLYVKLEKIAVMVLSRA